MDDVLLNVVVVLRRVKDKCFIQRIFGKYASLHVFLCLSLATAKK